MENINLFRNLSRVAAPADFEERVMAELVRRRQALPRMRRARAFRMSLAAASAVLLVSFVALNVFFGTKGGPSGFAGRGAMDTAGARQVLPITETLDYGREVQSASNEPRPVYILEQVSFASNRLVKY
jgi:hypothetical protein